MSRLIKDIIKEVLGENIETRMGLHKDTWWCYVFVESAIHEKKNQFEI